MCVFLCLCVASEERNGVSKDPSSRSHKSRPELIRTSSEGKVLDLDEPMKETTRPDSYKQPKAKTHVRSGSGSIHILMTLVSLPHCCV